METIDRSLQPYWAIAFGARRGPNRSRHIDSLNERCLYEPDPKLHKLYLKLEQELHNEQHREDAA